MEDDNDQKDLQQDSAMKSQSSMDYNDDEDNASGGLNKDPDRSAVGNGSKNEKDGIEKTDDITMSAAPTAMPPTAVNNTTTASSFRKHTTGVASSSFAATNRLESYTEAVPLSLSSMAHANLSLEDGVLDGLRQVLSHTLLSCVNYARIVHPPHRWTFRDLTTSPYAWTAVKKDTPPQDLPFALTKFNFQHQYTKNALIYLKPALANGLSREDELDRLEKGWANQVGILGRVSLVYASKEQLTPAELNGTDTDDVPHTILYKIIVEYRSLPPTGNKQAVQAEELSMLSFGGSVDDDVKYGALASLYDEYAKYVLEIFSVRGKKYKFDLMDATLSNGTVPQLQKISDGDPFVKALCVTVTEHDISRKLGDSKSAITQLHLTLEGKPRKALEKLPPISYVPDGIKESFLLFDSGILTALAQPSMNLLILDPEYAGRLYVNGRFVAVWGQEPTIGSHGRALFGVDLQGIPYWQGRVVDFEALKKSYATTLQELLVDARLLDLKIARRLLFRLLEGRDPPLAHAENIVDIDTEVSNDCLESQVLSSPKYDPVGIAAKALATRFQMEFGKAAFPCLEHEVDWVKEQLPGRFPKVVPLRLLSVLRRGGYFDVKRTVNEVWFSETRSLNPYEKQVAVLALQKLVRAGCTDISEQNIVVVRDVSQLNVVERKTVLNFSTVLMQYSVLDSFFTASAIDMIGIHLDALSDLQYKSDLLALYLAQANPNSRVLPRYLLTSKG